jgi:DNA-binding transcriptional regulator YiaG
MPNIAAVLKAEITRVARKEVRAEVETLRKSAATYRTEIAALKRRIQELEQAVKKTGRAQSLAREQVNPVVRADEEPGATGRSRFSAKGMASNRKRLGLSAADYGLLVGTSGQWVYLWESGRSVPRASNLAAIAALRGIGKRAVAARLAALKPAASLVTTNNN